MKILVWVPPWSAQGDPLFYRNCLQKHLIPQANLLASAKCSVDLVFPELLHNERGLVDKSVKIIDISLMTQIALIGSFSDPSLSFYREDDDVLISRIISGLSQFLAQSYDVILLWETPVPFFRQMYPDALIVEQMPGAFSRPPYPHMVVFDPTGLYRNGSLYLYAKDIQESPCDQKSSSIAAEFAGNVRTAINSLQPFGRNLLDRDGRFRKLVLLPLQVSAHYSFQADTSYENQSDFLLDVLNRYSDDVGIVVTQYVTPRVKDTVLTKDVVNTLRSRWSNLIYREEFDTIPSVSQYLLPLVDEVVTCSSSLGLQAMAWPRRLTVWQNTFLQPFTSEETDITRLSKEEKYHNTLAFLINRNQPMASAILEDRQFLLSLLEEMHGRKRSGASGLDLLPSFSDIDPGYSLRLLDSFSTERAGRDLEKNSSNKSSEQNDLKKFRHFVSDPAIKAITFDVFDTLIRRPTEMPADVYKFIENQALKITDGISEDFAVIRLNAEIETRKNILKGEITIEEIYKAVQAFYGLNEELTSCLMQAEIELETRLVQARQFGKKFWQIAFSTGKPVYLVTDMYLPEDVIITMLDKAGYKGYRKIFLSRNYGVRKKEGGLFDHVLTELGLAGSAVLHVGDNRIADIEQAQARGIKTFRIVRSVDRMRGNEHFKKIYSPKSGIGERARSAIAGLTAHVLFDAPGGAFEKSSHFQGSPYNLGYAALGPMLTGFMLWLGRQAKRDGISRLYFLSREGWIFKQVYDVLHVSDSDAVPSQYLYASRRATRVAGLQTKGDLLALAGQPFRSGVMVGELLNSRFGVASSEIEIGVWQASGYTSSTEKLESDPSGRVKFSSLCAALSDRILEQAEAERSVYKEYLHRSGFDGEVLPAVVDLGWRANIQGAIGDLLGKQLHGYYYATLQGGELWKSKGHRIWAYAGDMISANHPSAVVKNRQFIEYLTCHIESSLIRLERKDDAIVPVFRHEENLGNRRSLIEEIHQGAIRFAMDFYSEFNHVADQIWVDPFLAERVFASFVASPNKEDAAMFVGHHCEDALGGIKRQFIIHSDKKNAHVSSVWKAGAQAFFDNTPIPVKDEKKIDSKMNFLREGKDSMAADSVGMWLESKIIQVLTNKRKYAKYERDRHAFFLDSKNPLAKIWYKWA